MGKVIGLSKSFYEKGNTWYFNIIEQLDIKEDDNHKGCQVRVTNCRANPDFNPFNELKIGDEITYFYKDDFGRLCGYKRKEKA